MTYSSEEHTVAEITIEHKQIEYKPIERKLLWTAGLVLLVLAIWGLSRMVNRGEIAAPGHGAAAADSLRDNTPPRLRQYAQKTDAQAPSTSPALPRATA